MVDLCQQLSEFVNSSVVRIRSSESLECLLALKSSVFGNQSFLHETSQKISSAPKEHKSQLGRALNDAKKRLTEAWKQQEAKYKNNSIKSGLTDLSLPELPAPNGSHHLTLDAIDHISHIFQMMGFVSYDGPEVEKAYFNFDALNMPPFHPARSMQDTFYLSEDTVLRTHTSNTQIRALQNLTPPLRIIAPGKVFRSDSDATHAPMFHQVEGFVVDQGISFSHLIWILKKFLSLFFNNHNLSFRVRPSYFPFTQPSAEIDIAFEDGTFLEVLGCGMIHPTVLANTKVDTSVFSGFAFGLGVERLAMLKHNLRDLRHFFEGNQIWLHSHQF